MGQLVLDTSRFNNPEKIAQSARDALRWPSSRGHRPEKETNWGQLGEVTKGPNDGSKHRIFRCRASYKESLVESSPQLQKGTNLHINAQCRIERHEEGKRGASRDSRGGRNERSLDVKERGKKKVPLNNEHALVLARDDQGGTRGEWRA